MVQLLETDIRTRDVLGWQGVHLFHFHGSSCSQKTRIVLNLKGVEWEAHPIDLPKGENLSARFLGINPRGLVPTLVIDGDVHIESNDIVTLLDRRFPVPRLIPEGREADMAELLRHEDDLHHDLRTISFRFTQPRPRAPKSPEALADYRAGGSGTVQGDRDPNKAAEIAYWERMARDGITDEAIRVSAARFRREFEELDRRLGAAPYILGAQMSMADIAWFIYVNRLELCGYPVERLHRDLFAWFRPLRERPEFAREVAVPPAIREAIDENHRRQRAAGKTLIDVAGL
ncbi:MAG: glutathione S-transferase family protein [Rhodospirillaceae bacterium]|nr:glutathione S-transferase family protein [Rhodospirillaceae bacterium]